MVIIMNRKKKLKLKKLKFHPVTIYILLTFLTIILSGVLSSLNFQTTYSTISSTDLSIIQNTVEVENLLNFDGVKYIISNAARNFISFAPLSMFLMMAIGISVLISSGFLDFITKKFFSFYITLHNFFILFTIFYYI